MKKTANIILNVNVSADDKKRILREEALWDAPKLVALGLITLTIAMIGLWLMANTTIPTPHDAYLLPWEFAKLR